MATITTLIKRLGRRSAIWGGFALLAIALMSPAYDLGIAFGVWQPLTRPDGVSAKAHYVSMIEHGTWFDCSWDPKRDVDVCRAWDDEGQTLGGGDYRLECEGRAATTFELQPSNVLSSNGKAYMIYLYGEKGSFSRALVPVTKDGKGGCPFQVTITYPRATDSAPGAQDHSPDKKHGVKGRVH